MFDHLEFALQELCRLDRRRSVLAAVSGGPDSLCLAHLLWRFGYPFVIAHLDHGLRPESAGEAQLVQRLAESLGVGFVTSRQDVGAYASQNSLSIEEAARFLRYRFLFQQAGLLGVQAVAVGHTADDQVETVLMHLLRGAGLEGLSGMGYRSLPNPWSQTTPLARPLLGVWREEITQYLTSAGLQPSLDLTNLDRRYYRNRLRHELIPQLEALNPGAAQRIWRLAALARADDEVIQAVVETAWASCCLEQVEGAVAFDARLLQDQPVGVQRRLVRRGIGQLRPGLRDIDYEAVERTLGFLAHPPRSGRMDLAAGLRLEMEAERLWIAAWEANLPGEGWPSLAPGEVLQPVIPGEVRLASGWRLQAEILPGDPANLAQALANPDPYQAWLDHERLPQPLLVRARRPGERFRPLGMDGHSLKLSDFMVNAGLPRQRRTSWPLLAAGEEIIWVVGYRIGESFRVRPGTQVILRLSLSPQPTFTRE